MVVAECVSQDLVLTPTLLQHWSVGNIPGNKVADGEDLSAYVGPGPPQGTYKQASKQYTHIRDSMHSLPPPRTSQTLACTVTPSTCCSRRPRLTFPLTLIKTTTRNRRQQSIKLYAHSRLTAIPSPPSPQSTSADGRGGFKLAQFAKVQSVPRPVHAVPLTHSSTHLTPSRA